ncbi:hypothetical protein [Polaromonas sp.]|uniref:hypothetical protein n=1 Tax=Polaromonas sp. TaxID=1869339 RepID=UPI00326517E1
MTHAASSPTESPNRRVSARPQHRPEFWVWLLAAVVGLTGLLALVPDGMAEALQTVIGWLIIGIVAALGVMAIVRGLERLLDCERD